MDLLKHGISWSASLDHYGRLIINPILDGSARQVRQATAIPGNNEN